MNMKKELHTAIPACAARRRGAVLLAFFTLD
jgi:hypothetical protein